MARYSVLFIVLLVCVIHVDSRRTLRERRLRNLWNQITEKLKNKTSNPFNIDVRHFDKEEMLIFPDVAYQTAVKDGPWKVMLHGWRYEGSRRKDWLGFSATRWVERIAQHLVNKKDIAYLNGSLNRDRLRPFFVEDESDERITARIGDRTYPVRTDQHGQFVQQVEISNDDMQKLKQQQGSILKYEAVGDNQDKASGLIHLIEPRHGISVISDIDDTIKVSEVLDKVRLLANTFIHAFTPVPGMADLYQQWRVSNNNCTFHYLSGMPDQLYTLTQEFIYTNNFPDGSFHMRHFGWAAASLFDFLHSQSTFIHKMAHLRFFLANTVRDFVLVGDSGEKDPEIYGTITREYPDRIRAIFIRAIKGESFDDQRFISAFDNVPREKWQVFDNPSQVPTDLSRSPKPKAG